MIKKSLKPKWNIISNQEMP